MFENLIWFVGKFADLVFVRYVCDIDMGAIRSKRCNAKVIKI